MSRKKKKNRSMSNHLVCAHRLIFCREFRFTLSGNHLKEHFVKNVKMDLFNKHLDIDIYQVFDGPDVPAIAWLDKMKETDWGEKLVLTTYDGCGSELYQYTFKGITLKSHTVNYDYSSSKEAVDSLVIGFKEYERECLVDLPPEDKFYHGPVANDPQPKWQVAINIAGKEVARDIQIKKRPTCNIEETPITFLNHTTWIPGKATWEPFEFSIKKVEDIGALLRDADEIVLRYYQEGQLIESWELKEGFLNKQNYKEGGSKVDYEFTYNSVNYKRL